jgi:hypothetical protein
MADDGWRMADGGWRMAVSGRSWRVSGRLSFVVCRLHASRACNEEKTVGSGSEEEGRSGRGGRMAMSLAMSFSVGVQRWRKVKT